MKRVKTMVHLKLDIARCERAVVTKAVAFMAGLDAGRESDVEPLAKAGDRLLAARKATRGRR